MRRLEQLLSFYKEDPKDGFVLYSLGQEYSKREELDQSLDFYLKLREVDPNYVGMYYHLGKLYEKLGQSDRAISTYQEGMNVARNVGDQHALGELNGAHQLLLDQLSD